MATIDTILREAGNRRPSNFNLYGRLSSTNIEYRTRSVKKALLNPLWKFKCREVRNRIPEFVNLAVRQKEYEIIRAVAYLQLERRGIDGRGIKLWSYAPYSKKTIAIKRSKGQPTTRVTLRDTGDFQDNFHLYSDNEGFWIRSLTSDRRKVANINYKYGQDIYKLTKENFYKICNKHIKKVLYKEIVDEIRRLFNIKTDRINVNVWGGAKTARY